MATTLTAKYPTVPVPAQFVWFNDKNSCFSIGFLILYLNEQKLTGAMRFPDLYIIDIRRHDSFERLTSLPESQSHQ